MIWMTLTLVVSATFAPPIPIEGSEFFYGGKYYKLSNIDTPEWALAKCDAERLLFTQSYAGLAALLSSGEMEIVVDPGRTNPFYTMVRVRVRGFDVGEAMIAQGLAVKWEGKRHDWCGARSYLDK